MPYTAKKPGTTPDPADLRARIPGWGADLDPADRPSVPREQDDPHATGAHWELPESQGDDPARERSIEHERLTPVYGTAQPLHGVSGAVRRFAYDRFSEGRAAHWLLLVLGDRLEATGAHLRSLLTARPDNPVTETGILGEPRMRPIASRRGRVDIRHAWIDPVLVAGPWILGGWFVLRMLRRVFARS